MFIHIFIFESKNYPFAYIVKMFIHIFIFESKNF